MKIIIATDSYKGSFSSMEAACLIEEGIRRVFKDTEIIKLPIADGGEGTVAAFVLGLGGKLCEKTVTGPLGEQVNAVYGLLPDHTAIIEMAAASGLPLVPEGMRNPKITTTYGVGELMREAINQGCNRILVGLGGSATNDGGVGMAQALGVVFTDKVGKSLSVGGGALKDLYQIDRSAFDRRVFNTEIIAISDVRSPLLGADGASRLFAPQKGADAKAVEDLETALERLADVTEKEAGIDFRNVEGAGAAGGLGFGLAAFCGAKIQSGVKAVLNAGSFDKHLDACDLVITGEGHMDRQSVFGKAPIGIAEKAREKGVRVLAIVGGIGGGAEAVYDFGIDAVMCTVCRPMTLEEAIADKEELLRSAAERAMRMIDMGRRLKVNSPLN